MDWRGCSDVIVVGQQEFPVPLWVIIFACFVSNMPHHDERSNLRITTDMAKCRTVIGSPIIYNYFKNVFRARTGAVVVSFGTAQFGTRRSSFNYFHFSIVEGLVLLSFGFCFASSIVCNRVPRSMSARRPGVPL